ncbi:major capsid protein [Pseudomonas phage vB_PsaM_M1]|nr:major capsid protein [Pseudomonas phage vB_PsaM_M1]
MSVIRDYYNSFKTTEMTDAINEIENQYGYINSRNYFNMKSTGQTAIIFDVNKHDITLLPQVNRGDHSATQGKEREVDTFALKLAYFKHQDRLMTEDIQSWRQPGQEIQETLARATAEKLQDMRMAADQSTEYMKLQAFKGVFKTPDGKVVADMFTQFGVTQEEIDFVLGTSTTNVDDKIAELKRYIAKNVKQGGAISGVEVLVDPIFFDKLVSHPQIRDAWKFYQNSGTQRLRDDLANYMQWGVMDVFEHRGVRFMSYDATFNLPNGTTEQGIADDTGHAYGLGVRDLFRGYSGPSNKLSMANQPGREMFVRQYVDDRDEYVDFELEMAPLYFCTKPASLVKVISSN